MNMERVESLDQWPAQEDREENQGPNLMNTRPQARQESVVPK